MTTKSRRRVLKGLGMALPAAWGRPVVEAVVLPAHAQTSTESKEPGDDPIEQTGIQSVALDSDTVTIEGPSVPYTIELTNATGSTLSVIGVQAWIEQGTAERAASGSQVTGCGANFGELDPGSCVFGFVLDATNTGAGSGTLVPGSATARFDLLDDFVLIDQIFANITLV